MKFTTAILSSTLLASTALAAPLTSQRAARHEARRQARSIQRTSNPPLSETNEVLVLDNSTSHVQYSQNWAGAVLVGTGYTAVTGTFTVPTPQAPSGSGSSSSSYAASAWVGIDGDTWTNAILQTGVDFTVENGEASFDAWYEWYPDYAYDFSGIDISAGDQITITVEATSTSAGTATVENVSSGQKVTHTFSGGEGGDLGELNAEWIVEDFEQGGSLVPLANFGTVTFSNAQATSSGSSVGPSGAQILDIKQSGTVYTDSSVTDDTVVVAYQS